METTGRGLRSHRSVVGSRTAPGVWVIMLSLESGSAHAHVYPGHVEGVFVGCSNYRGAQPQRNCA